MIHCDAEYCEHNFRGICHANPLELDGNGVCITIMTTVRDEDEDENEVQDDN